MPRVARRRVQDVGDQRRDVAQAGPAQGRARLERRLERRERQAQGRAGHLKMKALVDAHYPAAVVAAVVLDNLSTHSPAALYQAFPPEEARRILRRLGFHDTPKHGSWLNMAELEFSVLGRQRLDRRIPDQETLRQRDRRLAGGAQRGAGHGAVAVHGHRRPDQAAPALSSMTPVVQE
jgi:DDE superfamily endonuclease